MEDQQREWWRDARSYRLDPETLRDDSPLLTDRQELAPAIEFIVSELHLTPGARILDLCCGPGRYATELALRGFDVVGLDLNPESVALGRRLALREGVKAEYLVGDMREIPFRDYFDAVINVGTSFGLFDDDADNQRVFDAVATALKPNGVFLLEMGNRDYYLRNFGVKDWRRRGNGRVMIFNRTFDYVRGRINTLIEYIPSEPKETFAFSWRAYTLAEVVSMFQHSGLIYSRAFGGWNGSDYDFNASRMVTISQKQR